MVIRGWEWQSDFARKYVGQGREEGRAEGKADDVLAVCEIRGIALTDAQRERIRSCTDTDQLSAWHRRAVTATTIADVLD